MEKKLVFYLLLLLVLPLHLSAQFLENPSLEGPVGIGLVPPHWLPFNPSGTPDTEPLMCDDFSASDGDTYITLVAHGSESSLPGINENCQTDLLQILEEGSCYNLSVDLASRSDLGHYVWGTGFINYQEEVRLSIFGSYDKSDRGDRLAESELITNSTWTTHTFIIKPLQDIKHLTLEISIPENASGNGNILVDNLQIDDFLATRIMLSDTFELSDLPITLSASESPSYSWSPISGLSCYQCQSPEVTSNLSQTYTCRIVDESTSCPLDEIFVLFINDIDPPVPPTEFRIPNVFTPNGDHINDVFEIEGLPPFSALIIFDRSGKELFSSENYDNTWDGRDMDGNPLPEDNYWYVLIRPGLADRQKGYIYLKRK